MNLENFAASLEFKALPPPGVYTFDEWWGKKPAKTCLDIHCKQKVLRSFHFCPRCGRGLRPQACVHYLSTDPTGLKFREVSLHDPSIVVMHIPEDLYKLAFVKCLDCGRSTPIHGRVSHALDHWNRDELFLNDPEYAIPDCPRCHSAKLVATNKSFSAAFCAPCGHEWKLPEGGMVPAKPQTS